MKALGREALKSGIGLVGDIAAYNVPPRIAVRNRAKQLTGNLKRKADNKIDNLMEGSGYKRGRTQVTIQSLKKLLNVKNRQAKRKKPVKRQRKRNIKGKKKRTTSQRKRKSTNLKDIFD